VMFLKRLHTNPGLLLLVGFALLLAALALPVAAQSGNVTVVDETGELDVAAVQRAAQPLAARGARVGVFLIERGGEDDALRRYQRAGLASGSAIDASTIAIYVSFDPRYAEIAFGDRWNAALLTNDNAGTIRQNQLVPGLTSGDETRGVVDALTAIERSIAAPPAPAGGTTVINQGDTVNVDLVPVVIGVIAVILLLVAGPLLWRGYQKRRSVAQALQTARTGAQTARRAASAAIADMGQVLRAAQEKAQFDRVSYAEADVRQLAETQGDAEARFVQAQEAFAAAEERLRLQREPTQAEYEGATLAYTRIAQEVAAAREALAKAEARRAELDAIARVAPGEVDKAKKALADAAEQLGALGEDVAQPEAVLRPVEALVERAVAFLEQHRAADAITAAGAASAAAGELATVLARFNDIRAGIAAGRVAAEKAAALGFRIDAGLAAFGTAEGLLRQAATALPLVGAAGVGSLLDQADRARELGVIRGGSLPARRRANEERLEKVRQAGEALAAAIDAGWRAFDIVDEFAESTWSDIRGNGSEAEKAADEAQELWEQAAERNSMERQEFIEAAADLDRAEERIAAAHALIDAILQRLKDLEAARAAARDEIMAAEADIARGREYVAANDPDVGKEPERLLARAESALAQARAEIQQERPDWLAIVRQAVEANRLADQALVGAQSDVDAMNKLRVQLQHVQQIATAETQKIIQFVGIHPRDIPAGTKDRINGLNINLQAANTVAQGVVEREEEARAAALRDAIERYTALEQQAARLYEEILGHFQRLEDMRRQVTAEVERAHAAITGAERTLARAGGAVSSRSEGVALLQDARSSYSQIGPVYHEADLQRALGWARDARDKAERAERFFDEQIRAAARRSQDEIGDFVGGMIVGSILSGGRSSSRSSSWGSGGGRRSAGSWSGGGRRSGGGFGGGSRRGGGW